MVGLLAYDDFGNGAESFWQLRIGWLFGLNGYRVCDNTLVRFAEGGDVGDVADQGFVAEGFEFDRCGIADLEEEDVNFVNGSRDFDDGWVGDDDC